MKLAATAALVAGILVSGLAPAALARKASPARVVSCSTRVDFNVEVSSARNMTCRQAARDLRRHRGSIGTRFRTPGGFACRRVAGSPLAGQWRCVRTTRAYRFEFGD
jgi:hypothetical protein